MMNLHRETGFCKASVSKSFFGRLWICELGEGSATLSPARLT